MFAFHQMLAPGVKRATTAHKKSYFLQVVGNNLWHKLKASGTNRSIWPQNLVSFHLSTLLSYGFYAVSQSAGSIFDSALQLLRSSLCFTEQSGFCSLEI